MSPESQLEAAVFFVASKVIDPDLRAQFLDQACAEDARMRAAVAELLQACLLYTSRDWLTLRAAACEPFASSRTIRSAAVLASE